MYYPPAQPNQHGRHTQSPPASTWTLAITATLAFLVGILVTTTVNWAVGGGTPSSSPAGSNTSTVVTATTTVLPNSTEQAETMSASTEAAAPAGAVGGITQVDLDAAVQAGVTVGGGTAGIALDDGTGTGVLQSGTVDGMVSWSSIKVPLAIAALRANPNLHDTAFAAITYSDNGAAQALWDSLGAGEDAAQAVSTVVAETGQSLTVNPFVTRPGFTAFGQTLWSLPEMAYFAARLDTVNGAEQVIEMMGQVVPDQSYGLGRLPSAQFKGGWGPTEAGGYTTRQLGRVRMGETVIGIAVYAAPADGSYATSQAMLDAMVAALP